MRTFVRVLATPLLLSIALVGCGDDDDDGGIEATLSDFEIDLDETSAPAGSVTFDIENEGPSVHEFVVFETDLAPDALPTDDNGDVAEGDDFAPVDEVEDIEEDEKSSLTMELEPGSYVIICNVPGHYRQGMHVAVTVT